MDSKHALTYPGHPVAIAAKILELYPSLEAATGRTADLANEPLPSHAVRNAALPGAGGNVYAALDLLKYTLAGHAELARVAAEDYWKTSAQPFGEARVSRGQQEACEAAPAFEAGLRRWRALP